MADVTSAGTGGAGLGTPAARWALIGVWLLGVTSGLLEGRLLPPTTLDVLAYLLALGGSILLTSRGGHLLAGGHVLGVVAASLTSAALVLAAGGHTGEVWLVNFASYLLALMIARGNVRAGTLAGVLLLALVVGWPAEAGHTVAEAIAHPVIALLVGGIWRMVLHAIVTREREHRELGPRAELEARAADEAAARNRHELQEISVDVVPLLRAIQHGAPIDEQLARTLTVTEASIRDRIRSPWLQHPTLNRAVTGARRRGVPVLLLGESAGGEGAVDDVLAAALGGLVAPVTEGSVTVRAIPAGRGPVASVLVEDHRGTVRTVLAADGTVLERH